MRVILIYKRVQGTSKYFKITKKYLEIVFYRVFMF